MNSSTAKGKMNSSTVGDNINSLVLSPTVPSMEDATIDILIEAETRQWNYALIDGIFAPQEAELIKKKSLLHGLSKRI